MGSLLLIRHSTTEASSSGRNLGQRSDPSLTDEGRSLAARLGERLAAELRELPHDELRLVSSPALRCRQTAEALAASLTVALEIEVEAGLIEIDYGAWEGLTSDECRARDPELRRAWEADPHATRCPDGESGADVEARAFPVLERIASWAGADRARCAIVVAHNHVNRLWLCAIIGWPLAEYRDRVAQDPAGYSIVTFPGAGRVPVVRRVNAAPA